jgi:hypothetical protein
VCTTEEVVLYGKCVSEERSDDDDPMSNQPNMDTTPLSKVYSGPAVRDGYRLCCRRRVDVSYQYVVVLQRQRLIVEWDYFDYAVV